jgi:hypothetical protein
MGYCCCSAYGLINLLEICIYGIYHVWESMYGMLLSSSYCLY